MRAVGVAFMALLLATGATPAFAGGGLPMLGTVDVGPYQVALHNDSPTLVTGANAITVEIASLPEGSMVSLRLDGPRGESVDVPLKKVVVLGGSSSGHGVVAAHDQGHGAHAGAPGTNPIEGIAVDAHGRVVPVAPGAPWPVGDQHNDTARPFQARGAVKLPSMGTWTARLMVGDHHGARFFGEIPLNVTDGGPNKLYLAVTGSLIAGSVLFGAVQRRRRPDRTLKAR